MRLIGDTSPPPEHSLPPNYTMATQRSLVRLSQMYGRAEDEKSQDHGHGSVASKSMFASAAASTAEAIAGMVAACPVLPPEQLEMNKRRPIGQGTYHACAQCLSAAHVTCKSPRCSRVI